MLSKYRLERELIPLLCQIRKALSSKDGRNKWLTSTGEKIEDAYKLKFRPNCVQIRRECLTTGLTLNLEIDKGREEHKRAGRDAERQDETSISNQIRVLCSKQDSIQYDIMDVS